MNGVRIFDNVLDDPAAYRAAALALEFKSYDFGHCVFHGIATGGPSLQLLRFLPRDASLTFFRKSPLGQVEPHYIHSDIDMGDWSAILYLNPRPPIGDGTSFWTHRKTGAIESTIPHERSEEGRDSKTVLERWKLRQHVPGVFNRLLIFPSSYFHSRAIPENWGEGDDARLIQVAFGKGEFS